MKHEALSIRPFIGARDFDVSRHFYSDLGFEEVALAPGFSIFKSGRMAFYLQDAYVKDRIDNTMVFMEVTDADAFRNDRETLRLPEKYAGVRIAAALGILGKECFVHDPSGILWHFGQFNQ
jgi:catechol 2,3-dioxygenase-like lactoylglutathione lyase family enzyme